jgi:hypothetical protein
MESTYMRSYIPPEVNVLILDQMNDEDLLQYCQINIYADSLCNIPKIKNRIETYKYYKTFELFTIFNDIEKYVDYPIMVHHYEGGINEDNQTVILDTVYVINVDKYSIIQYYAAIDQDNNNSNYSIEVTESNIPITMSEILELNPDTGNDVWALDLKSTYMVYVNIGLEKYAKDKVMEVLNANYNLKAQYQTRTLQNFYLLFFLFEWFKTNAMILQLVDYDINNSEDELDIVFLNSTQYNDIIKNYNIEIDYIYNLIVNYFD